MVDCHHNNDTLEDNDNNLLVISCYTPILTFFLNYESLFQLKYIKKGYSSRGATLV